MTDRILPHLEAGSLVTWSRTRRSEKLRRFKPPTTSIQGSSHAGHSSVAGSS
jgi:hypothetical protein